MQSDEVGRMDGSNKMVFIHRVSHYTLKAPSTPRMLSLTETLLDNFISS
jgi:hypothetical protein